MKRKTTKDILLESFRELAESNPVDRITIQEIVDNCGYSPATFYRQFQDKYDLIAWDYSKSVAKIMEKIDGSYTWKQSLLDGAEHFFREKDYLENLLRHTGGHDSFVRYMTDINCSALEKHILLTSGQEKLSSDEEMYIRLYCMGTVCLTCEWILGLHEATVEELAEIYMNSLPAPLHKYLL
ncbi:MAG: TetR family transcriptional regulator [Sphaerochaetaceae bacterium]|nr:TetR family transcriptional regulator [Sphaerochaetaceae bacterium]